MVKKKHALVYHTYECFVRIILIRECGVEDSKRNPNAQDWESPGERAQVIWYPSKSDFIDVLCSLSLSLIHSADIAADGYRGSHFRCRPIDIIPISITALLTEQSRTASIQLAKAKFGCYSTISKQLNKICVCVQISLTISRIPLRFSSSVFMCVRLRDSFASVMNMWCVMMFCFSTWFPANERDIYYKALYCIH